MKQVSAILLAAGRGERFKSRVPKPLVRLGSKPIVIYSLETLSRHPSIKDVIVVANDKNSREITQKIVQYGIRKVRRVVRGGKRRQDSVLHALCVLENGADLVLIHDAARPFIDKDMVSRLIKQANAFGAAITGVPIKATVKKAAKSPARLAGKVTSPWIVEKTIERDNLWEIQTPQVFKKDLIVRAYQRFARQNVTDDAMLVEKMGKRVVVVPGSYDNIKITTPEDLVIGEAIARKRKLK
jgi:2-C-methyl-D-erythritol 4-phosphate cytidylyltransferase